MTIDDARRLLDAVKDGETIPYLDICIALRETGDLYIPKVKLKQIQKEQPWLNLSHL